MIFKTIPQNGASWLKPVFYILEFEQKEEQVEVEIYDQLSASTFGRIMLYNVTSAQIDISPYIRSQKLCQTLETQKSIIGTSPDACNIVLRVNGEQSIARLLFRSKISGSIPRILSTVLESETVAAGETIRLTLFANRSISLTILQPSDGGFNQLDFATHGLPCEVALPINVATPGETIVIRVTCDNQLLAICKYRVVERDESAVRLAWVNSKGGMECHTFPQSVRRSIVVKSEDLEGECGWYRRIVGSTIIRRLIMTGATHSEVDSMLDMLLSPKVFRCDSGENVAVQLLTDSITYDQHGKLQRLEFDIKEEWKGGGL